MYELIRPAVKDKTVLELAAKTMLIAKHIVKATGHIEVTDASPEMIPEASGGITTDTALKTYLEQAGFCKIQSHKNKRGWLCITAQK